MAVKVGQRGPGRHARVMGVAAGGSGGGPGSFSLGDEAAAALGVTYESAEIAVSGIGAPASLAITGGEYAINGGAWGSSTTTVANGDAVKVRGVAPGSVGSATDVTLTIGGVSDTFTITTVANGEASSLIGRFGADPGSARRGQMDTLIGALKAAGVWPKLDALWLMAAHDEQAAQLNWVSASYTLAKFNAPAFTADLGYAGDSGASAWLDTGFNDLTGTAQYLQDSFHLGYYCNLNNAGGNPHVGTTAGATTRISASTTSLTTRVHSSVSFNMSVNAAVGHNVITRDGPTSSRGLHDGVSVSVSGAASAAPVSANLSVFRSGSLYNSDRIAALHAGGFLTPAEVASLYAALLSYLTALGAN